MKKHLLAMAVFLAGGLILCAQGQWEVSLHYSGWSIDVVDTAIEDNFVPDFDYYDPDKGKLNFDSNGYNYGLEIRFFPGGRNGCFSIGISYERNYFRGDLSGSYVETDNQGNRIDVEGRGSFDFYPHSINISLRWDLWPRSRIHPYIGFGFGFGPLNGDMTMVTTATTHVGGATLTETETETWTLKEAIEELEEEEGEEFPLGFFPVIQFQVGVRGHIAGPVHLILEGAFYNGLILRGGLAFRF